MIRSMTLKGKMVALFAVFMSAFLGLALFIFYHSVRDELERENLQRMVFYGRKFERGFAEGGIDGLRKGAAEIEPWQGRVTLIDGDGAVLYDSSGSVTDNHLKRPEIRAAAESGTGSSLRYSDTLRTHMHYYALSVHAFGGQDTFIRVAFPLASLTRIMNAFMLRSVFYAAGAALFGLLFWIWLTKRIFLPLEKIIHRAERIGNAGHVRFPLFRDLELRRLSTALNDMSERLRTADADIQARREELARIVEALPVGVVLTDPLRSVRYLNGVARKMFGDNGSVTKGTPVERLITNAEIYDMFSAPDACRTILMPPVSALSHEAGTIVEVSTITLPAGRLMVLRDVSVERRLEETRRNFTIDAGHELQTPLTAIRAAAELLLENEDTDPEDGKLLQTILRQQGRMTSLIDDLLLLVRLEDARPGERTRENLSELLASVAEEYRESPSSRGIVIETEGPEAPFRGSRAELLRAFSNIVNNAVRKVSEQYGADGGGRVLLSLKKEEPPVRETPRWTIMIADNGPGIAPELTDRIFESFHASGNQGKWGNGGHGLGLSIAVRVIRSHGGTIDLLPAAKSLLGGATFEITLPCE